MGLQDAMRGVLAAGGNHEQDWPIERILATADKAVGVDVLTKLHDEWGAKPVTPDLDALWHDLGLRVRDGGIEFDDSGAAGGDTDGDHDRTKIVRHSGPAPRGASRNDDEMSMRLIPIIRRSRIDLQRHRQQHGRERRVLHGVLHHRQRRRDFVVGHFEDQFVVHLQQHLRR